MEHQDNKHPSKDHKNQTQKKDKPLKHLAILSGIGIEMGVIIYLFVMLGKWLDASYNEGGKGFLVTCTLTGVAASLFVVVKQLNRINK